MNAAFNLLRCFSLSFSLSLSFSFSLSLSLSVLLFAKREAPARKACLAAGKAMPN